MKQNDQAHEFRERAEELRAAAEGFSDPKNQKALVRLAVNYERMAEALEARAAREADRRH